MSCQCPRSDHDRRFVAGHAGRAIHALRDQATAVLAEAGLGVHWQDYTALKEFQLHHHLGSSPQIVTKVGRALWRDTPAHSKLTQNSCEF